jgi:hypothetical protein
VDGPICHASEACREAAAERVARLRRDVLVRPAILIGTGTCGLGAGAGRVLEAVRHYLAEKKQEADVVEVGCIGLCTAEPILDVQLPGRTRLTFGPVTDGKVAGLLDAALGGQVPAEGLLGQHRPGGAQKPWPKVPYLDEHPFFAPQTRWVLANCGISDPLNIDEYVARGGYQSFAAALRNHTPSELC